MKLLLCPLLFYLSLFHTSTSRECWKGSPYQCWNAETYNVSSPSHFLIDTNVEKIVLTAKNSVCHISLELDFVDNVQIINSSDSAYAKCTGEDVQTAESCQNYHHVLLFPSSSGHMTIGDSATPINNTILECSTNAFDPQCTYRMRSNLTSVRVASADGYVPGNQDSNVTSIWTSTGRLVSASPPSSQRFGIIMSDVPYDGSIQVGTITQWFDKSVQFVSMYEIGDYIFTFFRENPDETTDTDVYSRVSRVCKGDMGVDDSVSTVSLNYNVFTSFLKARMTCVSGGENGDIPYYYDNLQDTFLVESETSDGGVERSLYAVFTSPQNGPEGSAVCVFSFGSGSGGSETTLSSVFEGDYLFEQAQDVFVKIDNPIPLTCPSTRPLSEANSYHLMYPFVTQSSGHTLHVQLTGYSLRKILVTSVMALDGVNYDIMFIAGTSRGSNVLLKTIYDAMEEKHHVIFEIELKLSEDTKETASRITQMQFLGNGSDSGNVIYVGTTDALYKVPVANCERYETDCCACVAARDPHCAYDRSVERCVTVMDENRGSDYLVQSVAIGDIDVCAAPPGNDSSPDTPTTEPTTTTGMTTGTSSSVVTPSSTPGTIEPPSVGGINRSSTLQSNLGTIIGSVFGFVGGVVIGIVMAFCYKNKDRFCWGKYIGRTPATVTLQENQTRHDKGASNKEPRRASAVNNSTKEPGRATAANNVSKAEDYERNNCDLNPHNITASAVVHVNPISNFSHSREGERKGSKDIVSPPPYTPTKPSPLTSDGECVVSMEEAVDFQKTAHAQASQSTPEHKINRSPPAPLTLSPPPKPTLPSPSQASSPLALFTPSQPSPCTLSTPLSTPSQVTPTPPPTHPPLTASQSLSHVPHYRRAPFHSGSHTSGQYNTLPHKRRPSASSYQTTPPQRPISAEAPPTVSFQRPTSAPQARRPSAVNSTPPRSVTRGTPTKQRAPHSPFSATPTRSSVPSSPFSGGSSAGTPVSTCSGSSHGKSHFQFTPPKFPEGAAPMPGPYHKRGDEGSQQKFSHRNPNVKATGMAVEHTTNQERERYGHNVAARIHTIDRKSKVPSSYSQSPTATTPHYAPHPQTTVIEINGTMEGCTDC